MTSPETPVGAVGDAAPTGDHRDSPASRALLNTVSKARGALAVEADTYRRQRDQARHALARVVEAYDDGTGLDVTIRRAVDLLNSVKDRP